MKKYFALAIIFIAVIFLSNCHSSKKTTAAAPLERAKSTYETTLKPVIFGNCTPCHIPSKGGNKKAYDNFENVKTDINEMIRRIELNPGEKGFMPFKKPKLSDSTIAVFKQWRDDGGLQ